MPSVGQGLPIFYLNPNSSLPNPESFIQLPSQYQHIYLIDISNSLCPKLISEQPPKICSVCHSISVNGMPFFQVSRTKPKTSHSGLSHHFVCIPAIASCLSALPLSTSLYSQHDSWGKLFKTCHLVSLLRGKFCNGSSFQ